MMMRKILFRFFVVLLISLNTGIIWAQKDSLLSEKIKSTLCKNKIRILITDSGLGGLSVLAEIEKIISANHSFRKAEIIFINALPSANFRYNSMPDESTKIKFFDQALIGMEKWFHPDIILIACNTLSVVYPKSEFYKTKSIPVVGIVELGVNLINKKLIEDPESKVIILGTETTISSNSHKTRLLLKGIKEERIFCQACPNLETEIQTNAKSDLVRGMIDLYSDEVISNIKSGKSKIFAALCCTHYPYVSGEFKNILSEKIGSDVSILNPNSDMANIFSDFHSSKKYDTCDVDVKVYSQVVLSAEEINSISEILQVTSPSSATALKNYINKTDLFILK
jgi:glutamate racemase